MNSNEEKSIENEFYPSNIDESTIKSDCNFTIDNSSPNSISFLNRTRMTRNHSRHLFTERNSIEFESKFFKSNESPLNYPDRRRSVSSSPQPLSFDQQLNYRKISSSPKLSFNSEKNLQHQSKNVSSSMRRIIDASNDEYRESRQINNKMTTASTSPNNHIYLKLPNLSDADKQLLYIQYPILKQMENSTAHNTQLRLSTLFILKQWLNDELRHSTWLTLLNSIKQLAEFQSNQVDVNTNIRNIQKEAHKGQIETSNFCSLYISVEIFNMTQLTSHLTLSHSIISTLCKNQFYFI